jgi:hypothetical protein
MKHKYSVLWFEDNEEVMSDDYEPALGEFLLARGFALELEHRKEFPPDVVIDYTKYDLIVSDLGLGGSNPDDAGKRVVEAVRRDEVLTDIVFYSSNATRLASVLETVGFIDRVTVHAGHGGLMEKIKKVVQLTIKKNEEIHVVRGQFIAQAIDLENKLLEFLGSYLKTEFLPETGAEKSQSWAEFVAGKLAHLSKTAGAVKTSNHTTATLHELKYFTSHDAYKLGKDALKNLKKYYNNLADKGDAVSGKRAEAIAIIREKLVEFEKEVIDVRNTLAHVKEATTGGKLILKSRKAADGEITIDEEWCTTTRRSLRTHHDNLEQMMRLLVAQDTREQR